MITIIFNMVTIFSSYFGIMHVIKKYCDQLENNNSNDYNCNYNL